MRSDPKAGDLFIVDNSISGWTALRYLREWCGIARSFDIATGYFEIGSLLQLEGHWQKLEKIRILMGAEMMQRTRKALLEAVLTTTREHLDKSLEATKDKNPFLEGVTAILEALRSGQIECRVYNREKFHAKAYITHAKMEVVGAQALVGSSNFTAPGLTENIELNIQVQSGREVAQLQEWFERHWDEAENITDDVITLVSRHTAPYKPFDVYAKSLHEFFRGHEATSSEWEESHSRVFGQLDRYQKEAYWALMKIGRQHGGAFLCDGVGLGKTFVGLMLIERLVLHEGKRVVLFAPKGAREAVWEPHLREWLSHIGGMGGGSDFSNLAVFNHTDLGREGDFPERFKRIAALADAVVIDEAHHFRNPGQLGDPDTGEGRSRYFKLFDMLNSSERKKTLYMLTATPINNRLHDIRHMAELFTGRDDRYFARTLGINSLTAQFTAREKALRRDLGTDGYDLSENLVEVSQALTSDQTFFRNLVVQRSRAYAKESQIQETGDSASFPDREPPKVAEYSIRATYGHLLDEIEKAFSSDNSLFALPIYYPLHYYIGDDDTIDPLEEGRQKQVVALIRTLFLKRFESSVHAFESSCTRLMKKLLAFLELHSETESENKRLERWKLRHDETILDAERRQLLLWDDDEVEEFDDDAEIEETRVDIELLDREEYDVVEIMQETYQDLDQIVIFLDETRKFLPKDDDKLRKLVRLLKTKDLRDKKVLVFTEFADTARYLRRELEKSGIDGIEEVDGGSRGNRADVIRRFSPYYNGTTSPELEAAGRKEIRVLISTDVLSEGLNLQDATRIINYDIHWNPVRLMQRIGRVDRRMSPKVEERLVRDHPEVEASRGKVRFWNFLPPSELNLILSLYRNVTHKTLIISATLGIEGKKLLTPEDDYRAIQEFNQAYEGTKTAIEEMHLEYQELQQEDPDLADRLNGFPGAIFSGRKRVAGGTRGVFFCFGLPALDGETMEFTEEAGTTRWYLYDLDDETILEEPSDIVASIRSKPNTPRKCTTERRTLVDIRDRVRKHITNTYLKRVNAPVRVRPSLKCWMELNED